MKYSFIIPVYNRPDEVDELLDSLTRQTIRDFEVVVVEDGSSIPCNDVVDNYADRLSIHYYNKENNELGLLVQLVGDGTRWMATLKSGDTVNIVLPLGNGFTLPADKAVRPLLVGGGVGVPPMYNLCKRLLSEGKQPRVVLGFNTGAEIFLAEEFKALGVQVHIATADGSVGTKGFVTDVIKELTYTYFYSCGPMPMFKAMEKVMATSGQYSFEERMGCGFGACMGCTIQTKSGYKRVCKDGPVFFREEVFG